MVDTKWIQTPEGQKAYWAWIRKLADRAEDQTNIPIYVDQNGEFQVNVEIEKKYFPVTDQEKFPEGKDSIITKLEFKTKGIILREIENIAKARDSLGVTEEEREEYCPLITLFQGIEDAITNDICYKATNAKQIFINNIKKKLEENEEGLLK